MSDAVTLDEKAGNFQEQDKEEACDIFLLRSQLAGAKEESPKNGHHAPNKDEKTEELQKEIEKGPDWPGFEFMGEGEEGKG